MKPRAQTTFAASLQRRLGRMSLRRKLVLLISGVSLLVVSLSMLASFVIEIGFFRDRLLLEYQTTARMLASNLEAAVAFEDVNDAQEILALLAERDYVIAAAAYLANGETLASYRRADADPLAPLPLVDVPTAIKGHRLTVSEGVYVREQRVGQISMVADLGEMTSFIVARSWIFVSLLLCAIACSILLASQLGRLLARPILDLAKTAQRISREQDYSTRHERASDDETGQLVDAFNGMMAEIQQREASLLIARDKAEASSKAKDDFLSVISHELRTPLNPIIGYVEMLLRQRGEESEAKQLRLIKQSAEHLQGIIDDILDYSRIERGVFSIASEAIDHVELCQDVVGLLLPEAERKGLALTCQHERDSAGLPDRPQIFSDRVRLRQILLNLVSNALKFTAQGSVTVRTRLTATGPERATLRFEVEDTGIGIAPEDRSKVFEPFAQIDESLTRQYSGLGLGLAISRKIAATLEGSIDFTSVKGQGSCFWIEIPVAVAEKPLPVDAPEPAALSAPSPAGRILLVDDQLVNRELAESLLSSCGQEVVCAKDGFDALEKAAAERFSLIIMDIKMPRMDGYETARRIRAMEATAGSRTPIIAMTAHVTTRGSEDSVAAGMDDFLAKPFTTAKLNAILEKWIRG